MPIKLLALMAISVMEREMYIYYWTGAGSGSHFIRDPIPSEGSWVIGGG